MMRVERKRQSTFRAISTGRMLPRTIEREKRGEKSSRKPKRKQRKRVDHCLLGILKVIGRMKMRKKAKVKVKDHLNPQIGPLKNQKSLKSLTFRKRVERKGKRITSSIDQALT